MTAQQTWTTQGIQMLLELELIDDAFCDIYAELGESMRGHHALGNAIDRLHSWRERHGFTYEPFGGAQETPGT